MSKDLRFDYQKNELPIRSITLFQGGDPGRAGDGSAHDHPTCPRCKVGVREPGYCTACREWIFLNDFTAKPASGIWAFFDDYTEIPDGTWDKMAELQSSNEFRKL